jgi:hypothetical protein
MDLHISYFIKAPRFDLLSHTTIHLFYGYVLVLIAIVKTTDSTCTEINLRQSHPRNTITVWAEGPQISADGKFEGCLKSFPRPVREGLVVHDVVRYPGPARPVTFS